MDICTCVCIDGVWEYTQGQAYGAYSLFTTAYHGFCLFFF